MDENNSIQLFEDRKIRTVWDEEKEEWYFSVVDVIAVLTDQPTARNASTYWAVLKKRLKEEGASELLTNCTPVGRQLRIAGAHLLDVLLGVSAFRQDRYNVLHGEIPFFLFLVPGGTDLSIFKKLDGVIFVHGLFPPSMGYSHSTMK